MAPGDPNTKNFNDPGYAWLPFALVDPTGKALPPGTYNFVWTWWWPTGDNNKYDFMVPSYSSCFDIQIDDQAEDEGFLTQIVKNDPKAHIALIGNTTSPGANDTNSPWPPYPNGYLQSNYDGIAPSNSSAKRTFQPYWTKHVDAVQMPEPISKPIYSIKGWTLDQLKQPIVSPPGSGPDSAFPQNTTVVGNITMMGNDSIPITEDIIPMRAGNGTGFNVTQFYPNSTVTDPSLTFNASAMIFNNPVSTYTAIPKAYEPEPLAPQANTTETNTTMPVAFQEITPAANKTNVTEAAAVAVPPASETAAANGTNTTEPSTAAPGEFANIPAINTTEPAAGAEPSAGEMPDDWDCIMVEGDSGHNYTHHHNHSHHDHEKRDHPRAWLVSE
jgi:hypothetical protein